MDVGTRYIASGILILIFRYVLANVIIVNIDNQFVMTIPKNHPKMCK